MMNRKRDEMVMSVKSCAGIVLCVMWLVGCESKQPASPDQAPPANAATQTPESDVASPTPESTEKEETLPDHVKESRKFGHVPISGATTREAVLEKFGTWQAKLAEVSADEQTAQALAAVEPGAEVKVFFGTWCSDCYNTLPVMWKTFDAAGDTLPFTVTYVALDEQFRAEGVDLAAHDIRNIPTIIVSREGKEVGRFIEKADRSATQELLGLLDGSSKGIISTNAKIRAAYNLDAAP